MLVHIPDHFSSKLKFNFKKLPAGVTDRPALKWIIVGFVCGTLMLWLSIFELFSFFKAEKNMEQSFLLVEIFAFVVFLIALGLIIYSIFSFIRCKKFFFDGKEFHIVYRPAIGIKHQFREPLSNYLGVRLRVLFVQSGLFNKNRYIIDLYHQDNNKIVPLYISTNNKNIRQIWEDYAKTLKLPALSVGDRGLNSRAYEDLDKSVKELSKAGKLPFIASGNLPAPNSLSVNQKKDSIVIEPKGIYWDTFSTLFLFIAIAATFILLAGGVYLTIIGTTFPLKYWIFGGITLLSILYFAVRLLTSYILVLDNNHVRVTETLFGSELKSIKLATDKIKNIELSYNPTIGRYDLTIISDEKILAFGNRLPVTDLLWLKDFVIRKLIGN